jgi:putative flavoprotein involved in K+ transport
MDAQTERTDTIVIGGGQAGLAVGYHLARSGRPFLILDANERIGDSWRTRWDSLRLFTPANYNGLPGFRFPAPGWSFPTKDEMGDYLEAYVERFDLPVRTGVSIHRLFKEDGRYMAIAGHARFEAERVVVATGAHRIPRLPAFASQLDPAIVQLHAGDYRSPSQLRDGAALVVGAGNSGAEIAYELAGSRPTWLAGGNVGEIPVPHGSRRARVALPIFRFVGHHVLTKRTPIGRTVGPKLAHGATPLIRIKSEGLAAAGVERVAKVVGVRSGLPLLEDERVLDVPNVVWCTGFQQDFSWIDLPIFGPDGQPVHDRGIARSEPGVCFVGLLFQYAVTSDVLPGVGRDAKLIAKHLVKHLAPAGREAAATALTVEHSLG